MLSPCLDCGELAEGSRCEDCAERAAAIRVARNRPHATKSPAAARGYDWRWDKLSRIARRMQPFCSDCGATSDLQCDHTPEAWQRKKQGKRIRIDDVDVVCGRCNRKRGAARGESVRRPSKRSNL